MKSPEQTLIKVYEYLLNIETDNEKIKKDVYDTTGEIMGHLINMKSNK